MPGKANPAKGRRGPENEDAVWKYPCNVSFQLKPCNDRTVPTVILVAALWLEAYSHGWVIRNEFSLIIKRQMCCTDFGPSFYPKQQFSELAPGAKYWVQGTCISSGMGGGGGGSF